VNGTVAILRSDSPGSASTQRFPCEAVVPALRFGGFSRFNDTHGIVVGNRTARGVTP
jgi:hypothetical protein